MAQPSTAREQVDVAVNIFAKPYQTSLSVLSLLRFSGGHIGRFYLQFEPSGSMYDLALPYVIAEYLGERAAVSQPRHWLKLEAAEQERFSDQAYRLSVRYQHAFENSEKRFLFVMHNDVLIKADVIGKMLEDIGGAFVIGQLGQCWNCPAHDRALMVEGCFAKDRCTPDSYQDFRPDSGELRRLYEAAAGRGVFVRPYLNNLHEQYAANGWPLPECRVNEWACLVNLETTREHTMPRGQAPPFGMFEQCGKICLDTSVAWFRELHRLGLLARNMDIAPFVTHWIGTGKMTSYKYLKAEENARMILEKHFPDYVEWCRSRDVRMFV